MQYSNVRTPALRSGQAFRTERAHSIRAFVAGNAVLLTAVLAALITTVIIPPDAAYIGYFDFKTLSCLFSVLAVVCALRSVNFFTLLARSIVARFSNLRSCFLALVYITFIGSMFIANDMALLTFLPLGWMVVEQTGKTRYTAFLFIMQNISANLGGMLTPFGNPQNLYLYTYFNIPTAEFMGIMLLPFVSAVALLTICCLFIKNEPLEFDHAELPTVDKKSRNVYLILFGLSVIMVFRILPYWIGLIVITAVLLIMNREAIKKVDYSLLLTFAAFFVFAGNMARIPQVRQLMSSLLEQNTMIFSILSCQFISNVPSAILLSQFTENYAELLRGVNIGGTGTLIASLASLITFSEYRKHFKNQTFRYVLMFTAFNLMFLVLITAICLVLK